MTEDVYDDYSIEDQLQFAARVSNASKTVCELMEQAAIEISVLRKQIVELEVSLELADQRLAGDDW